MKRYLILTAMASERADVLTHGQFKKLSQCESADLWMETSYDHEIYLAQVGVGPISAAMALTELVKFCDPQLVVLLGLGGGMDDQLGAGDVVVATSVIQHDAICSYEDRVELMATGELHLSLKPSERKDIRIHCSSDIQNIFVNELVASGHKVHRGTVLSGSEFVGAKCRKISLKQMINDGLIIDMEAAAVAFVCKKKNIDFSIIKTVADTYSDKASDEYVDYIKSSAAKCADVIKIIRSLNE